MKRLMIILALLIGMIIPTTQAQILNGNKGLDLKRNSIPGTPGLYKGRITVSQNGELSYRYGGSVMTPLYKSLKTISSTDTTFMIAVSLGGTVITTGVGSINIQSSYYTDTAAYVHGRWSGVYGGIDNIIDTLATSSIIIGGFENYINGNESAIIGGFRNTIPRVMHDGYTFISSNIVLLGTVNYTPHSGGAHAYQIKLIPRSSTPAAGTFEEGTIYYDSTAHKLKCWDGTQWQNLW